MRILHAALFTGVATIAIVMIVTGMNGIRPAPTVPPMIGLILAGVGALLVVMAAAVARPRIPTRGSTESADAYWTPARRQSALVLWAILEAAGLLGVVGYAVSGSIAALALVPVAIIVGVFFRPGALEV